MSDRDWIVQQMTETDIVSVTSENDDRETYSIEQVLDLFPNPQDKSINQLRSHQFEKDDRTNFHIDYIAAAANLRAENYDIEIAERSEIKRIAGNIIPAMATVTAMITGFVCLEVYKLLQGHRKLESYRNTSVNLCVSRFCLFQPRPLREKQVSQSFDY